jgi:hypothetical protein
MQPFRRLPALIIDGVYLGSGAHVSSMDILRSHKVTHILNVADDVENFFPNDFIYCNLHVSHLPLLCLPFILLVSEFILFYFFCDSNDFCNKNFYFTKTGI